MKFRKRVKVFPGFSLNFSSSGVSSSIGFKGASITLSKRGTYLNTSIPGTGLYDRQKISGGKKSNIGDGRKNKFSTLPTPNENNLLFETPIPLVGEIKSAEINDLTSSSLLELRDALLDAFNERKELLKEIEKSKKELKTAKIFYYISFLSLWILAKSFKKKVIELTEYIVDLESQLLNCYVNIDIHFDKTYEMKYQNLVISYKELLTSKMIWDITSSVRVNPSARSAASNTVTRTPVRFNFQNIGIVKSSFPAFHFENKNGGDIYIYPAFVIMTSGNNNFGLIDIKEFELNFSESKFLEEGIIPSDTKVIGKTWAKVNKNGQPDKRFKDNYEISVVRYGGLHLKSKTGLHESYNISNYEKSEEFVRKFIEYQNEL